MKRILFALALVSAVLATPSNAMGRMVRATGHYNANCEMSSSMAPAPNVLKPWYLLRDMPLR